MGKMWADKLMASEKKREESWPVLLNWLEHGPMHQNMAGSIPSQGIHPCFRFDPLSEHVWKATN